MIMVKPQDQQVPWVSKLTQFQRVHLAPGESQTLQFQITGEAFASAHDRELQFVLVPGTYNVVVSNGVNEGIVYVVKVQE